MGTLGVLIGCSAGRGHGWPALPAASCKGRGVCPSCNGRHMAQTAAHLADHVIPPVPVRQWVISVPKRLRGMLADRPRAVAALTKIFLDEIEGLLCAAATGRHGGGGHATEGCYDANQKPRSHDTSRIAWAKLMARVGEEFPLECPNCGGDIRLIAFRLLSECETIPGLRTLGNLRLLRTSCPRTRGPIRKILTHLGEPLDPPPVSPARSPPTDWGELVQVHF